MGCCVIFCAAEFDALARPLEKDDYILAADGGLKHTRKLGIEPNEIIGDFDSLGFNPPGAEVFPVEKDDIDAMLAVRRGLELGYREFVLYGSLDGPRLDHTVANFQTLQFLADRGAVSYLIGNRSIVTVVERQHCLPGGTARKPVRLLHGRGCPGRDGAGAVLHAGRRRADQRLPPGRQQPFYRGTGAHFGEGRQLACHLGQGRRIPRYRTIIRRHTPWKKEI